MTVPTRPVTGAPIASVWGDDVHDRTFAPAGCEVSGSTNTSVGTTMSKMVLATTISDPGGFLDAPNNQIEIPTDRQGMYTLFAEIHTVNGSAGAGFGTRTQIRVNGTAVAAAKEDNAGGTIVPFSLSWTGILSAGDQLAFYSQRIGGGTSPDVTVTRAFLYRHGDQLGA